MDYNGEMTAKFFYEFQPLVVTIIITSEMEVKSYVPSGNAEGRQSGKTTVVFYTSIQSIPSRQPWMSRKIPSVSVMAVRLFHFRLSVPPLHDNRSTHEKVCSVNRLFSKELWHV
jgi:hypothetical protein